MIKHLFPALLVSGLAPIAQAAETEGHGAAGDHGSEAGFYNIIEPFTDLTTNVAFLAFFLFIVIAASLGAFKFVGKALDDRASDIQRQLDESRTLREEAAAMLADAEKKQKEADANAEAMIKQAKTDAKAMVEQARKELAEKVARREAQAEARIARAEAEAAEDVRRTAADAATRAAKDVISGSSKRSDLFTDALSEIEKALN